MLGSVPVSRFFFFSSRRRHTRCSRDWSSDVCSSDLDVGLAERGYNVVIHEFAHKIHMDGAGDADFPAARAGMDAAKWRGILEGARSEERRVGKECRSRWSPYH